MKSLLVMLAAVAVLSFTGCSSETANLTTTQGQSAATLDANPGITQGQTVTSGNTQTGTVVNSVDGLNLVLSLNATGSGAASAKFKNTLAQQLAADNTAIKTYGQDVAVQLQKYVPELQAAAGDVGKITAVIQQATSAAGLTPVTPSQNSLYTEIENGTSKASSGLSVLENFLTGLSVTGSVQ